MMCEYCSKKIEETPLDDYPVHDESGSYHAECYEQIIEASMREAMPYVKKQMAEREDSNAYEWGDPKNAEYVEWAMEQADALRG